MSSMIDHPLVTHFLFYPRPLRKEDFPALPNGSIHTFSSPGGDMISAYWYRPLPEAPTLLLFHGNGEVATDYLSDFHQVIEDLGANFAVVDYRGYGLSQGKPCLTALLKDAHAAWDYFTKIQNLGPRQIVLMGRSLGSIAALELASSAGRDCLGIIIESGISSFHRWLDRMAPIIRNLDLDLEALKTALKLEMNHETKVKKISRPMLIMHTEHDDIVPSWNAYELLSWANPDKTTMKIFPQGNHNTIFFTNAKEYFEAIEEFIAGLTG